MSVKSSGSYDGPAPSNGEVIRYGVLKKMKTSRKKFFVLRAETPDALARLEYYDSEKKFKSGVPPKRCIALKTCFDINKRLDTRYKNVIALYTKDDCFCIVLDNENDLKVWLEDMLRLQHGEEMPEGEVLKPKFGELNGSLDATLSVLSDWQKRFYFEIGTPGILFFFGVSILVFGIVACLLRSSV